MSQELKKEVIVRPDAAERNSTIRAIIVVFLPIFALVAGLQLATMNNNQQSFNCVHGIDARVDSDMCMYDENVDASVMSAQWDNSADAGVLYSLSEDEEYQGFSLGEYFKINQVRPVITITSTRYPYSGIVITTVLCTYDDYEEDCSDAEYDYIWSALRGFSLFNW